MENYIKITSIWVLLIFYSTNFWTAQNLDPFEKSIVFVNYDYIINTV